MNGAKAPVFDSSEEDCHAQSSAFDFDLHRASSGCAVFCEVLCCGFPRKPQFFSCLFCSGIGGELAGFYLGLNTHYGWGKANGASLMASALAAISAITSSPAGASSVSRGDLGYTGIDYRGFTIRFRQKWLGSGRLRAGYAFERFLPFITGGFAYTNGTLKTATGQG